MGGGEGRRGRDTRVRHCPPAGGRRPCTLTEGNGILCGAGTGPASLSSDPSQPGIPELNRGPDTHVHQDPSLKKGLCRWELSEGPGNAAILDTLNPMTAILVRDRRGATDTQGESVGRQSWRDVATSPGTPRAPGAGRGRKDPPTEPPQEAWPCPCLEFGLGRGWGLSPRSHRRLVPPTLPHTQSCLSLKRPYLDAYVCLLWVRCQPAALPPGNHEETNSTEEILTRQPQPGVGHANQSIEAQSQFNAEQRVWLQYTDAPDTQSWRQLGPSYPLSSETCVALGAGGGEQRKGGAAGERGEGRRSQKGEGRERKRGVVRERRHIHIEPHSLCYSSTVARMGERPVPTVGDWINHMGSSVEE